VSAFDNVPCSTVLLGYSMMAAGGPHPAGSVEQLAACRGAQVEDVAGKDTPQRRLHALTLIWYGVKAPASRNSRLPQLRHALTAVHWQLRC
jgi:hypothetical protein